MKILNKSQAETPKLAFSELKPYMITSAALLIYVTRHDLSIGECYRDARLFVNNLKQDLNEEV